MRKLLRVFLNLLFVCLHLCLIIFMEALCAAKILTISKEGAASWPVWGNFVLIGVIAVLLLLHYLILYYGQRRNVIFPISVGIMTFFEFAVAIFVSLLFIVPNKILNVTFGFSVFFLVIQACIVAARIAYCLFWDYRLKKP